MIFSNAKSDQFKQLVKDYEENLAQSQQRWEKYKALPATDEENDLIRSAYAKGRGRITVQAKVHVEEMSRNRHRLVITELPYQTNKASITEKIAELARELARELKGEHRVRTGRQICRLLSFVGGDESVDTLYRTMNRKELCSRLFMIEAYGGVREASRNEEWASGPSTG